MVKLKPFEGDSSLGYVWHQNTGWRIVVIVDDWFDLPEWESEDKEDFPSAHAYGLPTLRSELPVLSGTRAVGFFNLPDPKSKNLNEEIQNIINAIYTWLFGIKDDQCRCYLLIDCYYGEGAGKSALSGPQFVNYLKLYHLQKTSKNSFPIKLAHLTVSGAVASNPHELEYFAKTEIHSLQKLPPKLRTWLDIDEHPLKRLWRITNNWFEAGRSDDDVMKHTTGNIQEYFDDLMDGRLASYRSNVEGALGLYLPDSWWQNPESVGHIHESLKCLCGVLFCGQCEDDTTKRPISTGAAFLIALMAHQHQCGNIDPLTKNAKMWLKCPKVATSYIFAKQDRHTAKDTAVALYEYLRMIFEVRNRSGDYSVHNNSQVNNVLFADQGRILRIELSWNSHQRAIDRDQSLAEMMAEIFQKNPIKVPESSPKNTREAVLKLWSLMAVSESGCLAPGVIYLENNFLTIASVK